MTWQEGNSQTPQLLMTKRLPALSFAQNRPLFRIYNVVRLEPKPSRVIAANVFTQESYTKP